MRSRKEKHRADLSDDCFVVLINQAMKICLDKEILSIIVSHKSEKGSQSEQ